MTFIWIHVAEFNDKGCISHKGRAVIRDKLVQSVSELTTYNSKSSTVAIGLHEPY